MKQLHKTIIMAKTADKGTTIENQVEASDLSPQPKESFKNFSNRIRSIARTGDADAIALSKELNALHAKMKAPLRRAHVAELINIVEGKNESKLLIFSPITGGKDIIYAVNNTMYNMLEEAGLAVGENYTVTDELRNEKTQYIKYNDEAEEWQIFNHDTNVDNNVTFVSVSKAGKNAMNLAMLDARQDLAYAKVVEKTAHLEVSPEVEYENIFRFFKV